MLSQKKAGGYHTTGRTMLPCPPGSITCAPQRGIDLLMDNP